MTWVASPGARITDWLSLVAGLLLRQTLKKAKAWISLLDVLVTVSVLSPGHRCDVPQTASGISIAVSRGQGEVPRHG